MSGNGEVVLTLPQEVTDGRQYHDGFPAHVVDRARVLILQCSSYAWAWRKLKGELEGTDQLMPSYNTLMRWGWADKDVMAHMEADVKRDIGEVYQSVAEDYAEAMVEARPHLSPSQIPVAYGIAADKPIAWAKVGQVGTVQAVQINIIDSKGESVSLRKQED